MFQCGEGSLLADGPEEKAARTLRCGCWHCETCVDGRRKRLFAEASAGAPNIFLTLTTRFDPAGDPAAEAKRQSLAARELLRRWARHKSRDAIQYFAVRESHKSGWPHLHILIRGPFCDWRWLRAQWLDITGSDRINVQAIKTKKHAVAYLAGYLKKAPAKFGTAKRYWRTQAYDQREEFDRGPVCDFGAPWERRSECVISIAERLEDEGWTVEWTGLERIYAAKPP